MKIRMLLTTVIFLLPVITFAQDASFVANSRKPTSEQDLRNWLENMVWHHQFNDEEIRAATGLSIEAIKQAKERLNISSETKPRRRNNDKLLVLPYPGGRHPRIGFLDGAIEPQRETKVSVFTPWDDSSYVVLDVPEAIWSDLGLTYLAHTHIPTVFDKQNKKLEKLEWKTSKDGTLECERKLPNGIVFGTRIKNRKDFLEMEMWLHNGTDKMLSDLRVQNCAMLKAAKGFNQQIDENKVYWQSYAACKSTDGKKWIIQAWDPIHRPWGNAPCPCLHADPKFPDCQPGATQLLRGWFSFFEGEDIMAELQRIEKTGWRDRKPL